MKNSSNSSTEKSGNTKQISPSIHWCFTLNNYTEEDILTLCSSDSSEKYIFQEETGENGTPHLQGYMEFKTKVRPKSVFKNDKIHWEKTRDVKKSIVYCSKEETRTGKIFNKNIYIPKPLKVITQLYPWQKAIEEIYNTEPDDRKINWYWEPDGNIGKTAFIKYMLTKYKALYCSGGKLADIMNLAFNTKWDEGVKGVFFNIPRCHKGHISYAALENIKDGLVCNTKYETGVVMFDSPHIFVFANFPPNDEEELSKDRWNIVRIEKFETLN